MKKFIFLFSTLLFSSIASGQITFESNFPASAPDQYGSFYSSFNYVKFAAGEKFVINDPKANVIKIYNSNHSLEKTITVPSISFSDGTNITSIYMLNVSDELFNLDSKVEYIVQYSTYNPGKGKSASFIRGWNEDGTSIFSKDSAIIYTDFNGFSYGFQGIVKTALGTKLVLQNKKSSDGSYEMYSLPGNVLTVNAKQSKDNSGSLSYPIPNPSSQLTKIEFELPKGVSNGEISFYNMDGTIVKKYLVDNTFGDLLLNNSDLPTGIYYYKLYTGTTSSDAKKMVVIK